MSDSRIHRKPGCRMVLLSSLALCWLSVSPCAQSGAGDQAPSKPAPESSAETKDVPSEKSAEPAKELVSGKVVFLLEALKRRGIKATSEMEGQVVLETATGELWPLISDWRGRAFFQDEHLRNRPVDLVVRRHKGVPYLQILMVFTFNEQGERQYTDYWCDICSIPMYEIKDCDCCRGPIRLRFQKQDLPSYLKPMPARLPAELDAEKK